MKSATGLSLEERCSAAVEFYSAIEATTYVAVNRHAGATALDHLIARLLGDHMKAHFIDGLAKLGIELGTPDAVQCALYHVLSNELGGYRVGYVRESDDKAWIFYDSPYVEAHPWMGIAYAGFRPSYWIEQMLNWHAYDGEAIGNPGIAFVGTHFVSLGDPYDAGYFIDTHRELTQEERLQFRLGEAPPVGIPMTYPLNDPDLWPHERRIKAHRNYARDYASATLAAAIRTVPDQATSIIEYVLRTVLFAQRAHLDRATGPLQETTALEKVARTIAYVEDLASPFGKESTVELAAAEASVTPTGTPALLSSEEWTSGTDDERRAAAGALAAAWTAWASVIATDLSVELDLDAGAWRVAQSAEAEARHHERMARLRALTQSELMQLA